MKDFETGISYLRKEALSVALILSSDNDDLLCERISQILRGNDPFGGDEEARARCDKELAQRHDEEGGEPGGEAPDKKPKK